MEKEVKAKEDTIKKENSNKNTNKDNDNKKGESKEEKTSKNWLKNKKNEKIKELEKQIEELRGDYLRSRADFDNFRKRKEKELVEAREKAIINFVMEILPAIDNFEMSLKMTDNKEMFIKGVEMIHGNLINTLKENKFVEFEPKVSEEFDPYMHDPVLIEDKSHEPGKVITVLKKGYLYKDKVIRPARVQVVKENENIDNKEESNLSES